MNVQLVESLVEVILKLSPDEQKLFQEKLCATKIIKSSVEADKNLTPAEKAEQFRQWVSHFPKSNISLPDEALHRENIYDDRGI